MTLALLAFLGFAILVLVTAFTWRIYSRRSSLPCPSWLAWMVELDNPLGRSNNARMIVGRLDLLPGMNILDIGCGPGRLSIPIAQCIGPQGKVLAIDVQAGMLRRARDKALAAGVTNIEFVQSRIGEGKFASGQYDRALLVTVLGEIPDRQKVLNEIYNLMKPGGILCITEIIFDPHYQSRRTILDLAGSVGFREKAFFGNRLSFTLNLEKPENA